MMTQTRLIGILAGVALLLFIPLIAMQFSNEVNWTLIDFIVAGGLLLSTGFILDFVIRKVKKLNHRIVLSIVIVAALILIWAELAVGIFGTPFGGN
jgi:hypothetical protein